jgi:hypothetical protein
VSFPKKVLDTNAGIYKQMQATRKLLAFTYKKEILQLTLFKLYRTFKLYMLELECSIVTVLDTPVSCYGQLKDVSGSQNMCCWKRGFLSQGVSPFNGHVDKKVLSQKA